MPFNSMSDDYAKILDQSTFVFNIIYNFEALIKLVGLRLRYFHDRWNILDFVIVLASDIALVLSNY